MTSFQRQLERLLATARAEGALGPEAELRLLELARRDARGRGALTLASVLGWLGGLAVALGAILLVAANWDHIPPALKIAGCLALLGGLHAAGLALTSRGYGRTAEALHFAGAGTFLAGVGLIAQIYHLDGRPPNTVLLWLVAIAPLAWWLRSPTTGSLAVFALLLWCHMEGAQSGSPLEMPRYQFTPHLVLELGWGVALVGASGALRRVDADLARVLRVLGAVLLFGTLFALGFFRHFSAGPEMHGSLALPAVVLGLAALALVAGGRGLVAESAWLRNRLLAGLGALLATGTAALLVDGGLLGRGPALAFFDFGWEVEYDLAEWLLTLIAWALWFLLAFWSIAFGVRAQRQSYVNVGVLAVALGVVTRFFDLVGGLQETGLLFVLGGAVLLGTAWGAERWRRSLLRGLASAREGTP